MTKLDKIKVDKKSKLEAKDNIQEELIAKDEIKKSLRQKLSEANRLTETMKSKPQQMEQELKCDKCPFTFNNVNTLTIHIQNKYQALSTDNIFQKLKS